MSDEADIKIDSQDATRLTDEQLDPILPLPIDVAAPAKSTAAQKIPSRAHHEVYWRTAIIYFLSMVLPVLATLWLGSLNGRFAPDRSMAWSTWTLMDLLNATGDGPGGPLVSVVFATWFPAGMMSFLGWLSAAWLMRKRVGPIVGGLCWLFMLALFAITLGFVF